MKTVYADDPQGIVQAGGSGSDGPASVHITRLAVMPNATYLGQAPPFFSS